MYQAVLLFFSKIFSKKVCGIKKLPIFAPSKFSIFDFQFLIFEKSSIKNHQSEMDYVL